MDTFEFILILFSNHEMKMSKLRTKTCIFCFA